MSCLFLVTGGVESSTSPPTQHKTIESVPAGREPTLFFQWEANLAHFPSELTCFSVVLFVQQMHNPDKWVITGKRNEQAFQRYQIQGL